MATTPVATDKKAQNNVFISTDNLGDRVGMPGAGTPQSGPDFVGPLFSFMERLGFGKKEDVKEAPESAKEAKKADEKDDDKKEEKVSDTKKEASTSGATASEKSEDPVSAPTAKSARRLNSSIDDLNMVVSTHYYGRSEDEASDFGANFGKVDTRLRFETTNKKKSPGK